MLDTKDIIQATHLQKSFHVAGEDVMVLRDIDFTVQSEDFLIIFGPSGCGKSTLLHIMLGLEKPSSGVVNFLGNDLFDSTDDDHRADLRKKHIGMVYQQSNWIRALNVIENVAFPLQLLGMEKSIALEHAQATLETIHMENWAKYFPMELSSGQQQRISLARSIIHNPMIIFADEPTGNLDYETGIMVMELLQKLNHEQKKTIVMVTHDLDYLSYAKTAISMFNGAIEGVYSGAEKEQLIGKYKFRKQYTGKKPAVQHD